MLLSVQTEDALGLSQNKSHKKSKDLALSAQEAEDKLKKMEQDISQRLEPITAAKDTKSVSAEKVRLINQLDAKKKKHQETAEKGRKAKEAHLETKKGDTKRCLVSS